MSATSKSTAKLGLIVGNRGFFPGHLAAEGSRRYAARVRRGRRGGGCSFTPQDARYGAVEIVRRSEALRGFVSAASGFARWCDRHAAEFGDERAIADTLRRSGLQVPVLIQATPDAAGKMTIADRRDSFCGKMSACNNLMQYGIPYSLTTLHTEAPDSDEFTEGSGVVPRRLPGGAGTAQSSHWRHRRAARRRSIPFATAKRFWKRPAFPIITIDLSEILGRIEKMKDDDPAGQAKLKAIQAYVSTKDVPAASLMKMAKLGAVVDGWMKRNGYRHLRRAVLDLARRIFRRGSLHGDEHDEQRTDVERLRSGYRRRGRHARVASGFGHAQRAARLEQQLRRRSQQGGLLPLQQFAQALLCRDVRMDYQEIIAGTVGKLNTFGTVVGKVKAAPDELLPHFYR